MAASSNEASKASFSVSFVGILPLGQDIENFELQMGKVQSRLFDDDFKNWVNFLELLHREFERKTGLMHRRSMFSDTENLQKKPRSDQVRNIRINSENLEACQCFLQKH